MNCNKRTCMSVAAIGLIVAALIAIGRKKKGEPQQAEKRATKWDKMRQRMEEMPEDFPPRVMYDNVETARANTERILEILHEKGDGKKTTNDKVKTNA